jgi:hypothetical protein
MEEYGAVALAPAHAEAAGRLAAYIDDVKETWRVWLAFGTGVRRVLRRSEEPAEKVVPEREPHQ